MSERKRVISGNEFMVKWAEALGLPPTTRRVVIDADVNKALIVYVSCYGTEDLLTIEPPSADEVRIIVSEKVQREVE